MEIEEEEYNKYNIFNEAHSLIQEFEQYNGKIYGFSSDIMIDGILHTLLMYASWFENYDEQIEKIKANLK